MWSSLKDEMAFLQKFPDLLQATTDDNNPTPTYLYNQLSSITHESSGMYCSYIVGFLISRIQYGSLQVQLKSLKVCQHLVRNGHPEFRNELKRNDAVLKEAGSLMDPFLSPHDTISPSMVRSVKQEVLNELFSDDNISSFDLRDGVETATKQPQLTLPPGYGSGSTQGRLPGFGSMKSSGSSGSESVVDNLSQMVNRMLTPSPPSSNVDRKADLAHHLPKYQPASLETRSLSSDISTAQDLEKSQNNPGPASLPARKICRGHKPGRAGGGWDEADFKNGCSLAHVLEKDALSGSYSNKSDMSADSLDREESAEPADLEETKFVDEFTAGNHLFPPSYTDIAEAYKMCSTLNCDKVVELLSHKLIADKESSVLRAMVLLEAMLHRDLVILEVFIKYAFPNLELLQSCEEDTIKFKARKIYLTVQKLSDISKQSLC